MQVELIETASEVRLRTAQLELGWSRESGALVVLARPGGPNLLGHGPPRPGLDIALGDPGGWTASCSFARYLSHRCAERADAVELTVSVGLGPLRVRDRYTVRGLMVERAAELENVGLDDLRLFGLRLVLPNARVGNAQTCRLDAPANSVRPRVPLAVAAAQRRDVLPRRFFAPGVRGGGALEPAPAQGPGLLALHGGPPEQTLLCWYEAAGAAALPYVEGADGWLDAVSLAHEVGLAGWLRPGERLAAGAQRLMLLDAPWERARERYRDALPPAAPRAAWVGGAPLYLCSAADYGGLAGLAAALPALAGLGVGAIALRPLHLAADGQVLDLERIDPALGDEAALGALVGAAHAEGLRVLLDLELQGCAPASRYLVERPEWFARNEDGGLVIGPSPGAPAASGHPGVAARPGCYSFDWQSEELQTYLLDWVSAQAAAHGLDGFRAVAPYSPALSWQRRPPQHAGDAALAPLAWLGRLRARLADRAPDLALLATLAGPAAAAVCDGVYDYPAHLMFVHAALARVTGHELGAYLDDLLAVAPPGVARVGFVESHDTCEQNPIADGLRGSRISRMLQAGLALCGFVPSLWSGQERGEEPFVRALLGLWRAEPALSRGAADFAGAGCSAPRVLSVLRQHAGRRLLGLMHTGPCPTEVSVALPGGPPRRAPRDLLGLAPCSAGPADDGLRLQLAPFSAYCLEL
ncbi:MAG TPA: alpha-amylase family glycosyl hydrolase [Chloroflexaceae bacterium]|nr:alpha-amylase family glycosyl hydrolase [Chloroflexaceae bacterium]